MMGFDALDYDGYTISAHTHTLVTLYTDWISCFATLSVQSLGFLW